MQLSDAQKIPVVVLKRWLRLRGRYASRWHRLHFLAQVELHGGMVEMDNSIHFNHPVEFQGSGQLLLGHNVQLGYPGAGSSSLPILLQPRDAKAVIEVGIGTFIVNGCEFIAQTRITIGANCLIGPRSVILDSDGHDIDPMQRNSPGRSAPVIIEDNVWFGYGVMVLKGVYIGRDAVVGAHCVVTKDIPPGAIVVGNPMKIIGSVYRGSA